MEASGSKQLPMNLQVILKKKSVNFTKIIIIYDKFTGSLENSNYGIKLKELICEVIIAAENIGLFVSSVVTDMGPLNQKMWRAFGNWDRLL